MKISFVTNVCFFKITYSYKINFTQNQNELQIFLFYPINYLKN